MVRKRRIMIEIPEEDLHKELGWFRQGMDEWAVRTYLIKYPQVIEEGLNLEHFVGFNIWVKSTQELDMLFNKNGTYFLIETKQKGKYYQGWKYLKATVEYFEVEIKNTMKNPKK